MATYVAWMKGVTGLRGSGGPVWKFSPHDVPSPCGRNTECCSHLPTLSDPKWGFLSSLSGFSPPLSLRPRSYLTLKLKAGSSKPASIFRREGSDSWVWQCGGSSSEMSHKQINTSMLQRNVCVSLRHPTSWCVFWLEATRTFRTFDVLWSWGSQPFTLD